MTRLPASRDPDVLGSLADTYAVLGEIGRGGMGAVVLARHRTTGYRVAIKIAATDRLDAEAIERFSREARLMTRFSHPNVVRLYGIHEIRANTIAIVMEYVRGKSLDQLLVGPKRLPFDQCVRILHDLGRALSHAHANGVIHRDVKPHNVLIEDGSGKAMLSDFGIAKASSDEGDVTAVGGIVGTPAYMSPEQIDGKTVDPRSDIYALGVLGWEMISGERPWAGEPLYRLLHKQKHQQLPSLTILRPDTPNAILLALEGALDKSPSHRWQSIDEMMEQLGESEPTRAMVERRLRIAAGRSSPTSVPVVEAPTVPVARASSRRKVVNPTHDRTQTLRLIRVEPPDPDSGAGPDGAASYDATHDGQTDAQEPSATTSVNARTRVRQVALFGGGLLAGAVLMLMLSRMIGRERGRTATAARQSTQAPPVARAPEMVSGVAASSAKPPTLPTAVVVATVAPWPGSQRSSVGSVAASPARALVLELPQPSPSTAPASGPTVAAARTLDRRASALAISNEARSLVYGGQLERARQLADSAIQLDNRSASGYLVRARSLIERNRVREAWTDIELGARSGARWEALALSVILTVRQAGRGEGMELVQPELREALTPRRPLESDRAVALAMSLAHIGDINTALTLLELAQPANEQLLRLLEDPLLAPVRTQERFLAVKARAQANARGRGA